MARGTRSRTPLFPLMALTHATEPRVLFGWFLQIRNRSPPNPVVFGNKPAAQPARRDGELCPAHPLPPAVRPWGTLGLVGKHGRAALAAPCVGTCLIRAPWRVGGGAVTPKGEGSGRRDSDSPWETARWQSWEMSFALALPPSPEHSAAWERPEAHRDDVLPAGSTHGRTGAILPVSSRADVLAAPGHRLSLRQGPPGTPRSPRQGLPFLKMQQNLLHFAFQKSLSLSKGNEGKSRWLGRKHQAAQRAVNRTGSNQALGREQRGGERDPLPKHHLSRLSHLPGPPDLPMAMPALVQTGRTIPSPAASCRPLRTQPGSSTAPQLGCCRCHELCPSMCMALNELLVCTCIPAGTPREVLCAPWQPHLSSHPGSPVPTKTPSTNHR